MSVGLSVFYAARSRIADMSTYATPKPEDDYKNRSHTPEPWHLIYTPGYLANGQFKDGGARREDPVSIASPHHTEEIATTWTYLLPAFANARRIVACVNACAGIPTETLEKMAEEASRLTVQDLEKSLAAITKGLR